jgi:hypothetical protein
VRLYELAAQRAGKLIHALQSHIVAAHDVLVDLQRDLDHLASEFAAPAADAPGAAHGDDAALRTTIITQLRSAEPEMALQIEEQLTKELFARHGGLQATMIAGGDARQKLIAAIRSRARQAALAKVVSIDLGAILLAADGGESPLAKCLQQAQPWLERCGGRRRLVFVIPQQLIAQYSPTTLVSQLPPGTFTQLPGVAAGAAGDLVVLYELGDVSLAHAAAHLIGFRRDLAEAASRLQTRSDVTWTPVFTF